MLSICSDLKKTIQFQEIRWEIQANEVEIKSSEGDRKQQVSHLNFLNISTIVSIQSLALI